MKRPPQRPTCSLHRRPCGRHLRGERFVRRTPASPTSCTPLLRSSKKSIEGSRRRKRGERTCKRRPFPPSALQLPPKILNLPPKMMALPPEDKCITKMTSLPPMGALSPEATCITGT
ncbi:unnamed protein product [Lampetra planeri]